MMRVGFYRKSQDRVQEFENVVRVFGLNQGRDDARYIIKRLKNEKLVKIEIPMSDARLSFVED